MMKILAIIPIATDRLNNTFHNIFSKAVCDDTEIHTINIEKGAVGIKDRLNCYESASDVVKEIKKAEKLGFDGVHVNVMFDIVGTEVAREIVNIPVLGAFWPNVSMAMSLARKISLIALAESEESIFIEHFRVYGMMENVASIRSLNIATKQINEKDNPEIIEKMCELSLKLVKEDNAEAIVFGCTAFFDCAVPVSDFLRKKTGKRIPVIDPNTTSINYLEMIVKNKLSHSQVTYTTT